MSNETDLLSDTVLKPVGRCEPRFLATDLSDASDFTGSQAERTVVLHAPTDAIITAHSKRETSNKCRPNEIPWHLGQRRRRWRRQK